MVTDLVMAYANSADRSTRAAARDVIEANMDGRDPLPDPVTVPIVVH